MCYYIESVNGTAYLAMGTAMELLKIEKLIIASAKAIEQLTPDIEKKFTNFINKGTSELSALLSDAEKSGNLLLIEILTNYNDLFKVCMENQKVLNKPAQAVLSQAELPQVVFLQAETPQIETPQTKTPQTEIPQLLIGATASYHPIVAEEKKTKSTKIYRK